MRRLLWLALTLPAAVSPMPARADHVRVSASVTAAVVEVRERSAVVKVTWSAACENAPNPSWDGSLNLVDQATGEKIYMGGVSSGSGSSRQLVGRLDRDRSMIAALRIACASYPELHGSGFIEVGSAPAVVPRLGAGGSGGSGGSGGGSGGGTTGDRDAPPSGLPATACAVLKVGTTSDDRLLGTAGHDRLRGLGGDDLIRGAAGHDCLDGGPGSDRLEGEGGSDALYGRGGADTLSGGAGKNLYDAGAGNDLVLAVNGRRETIRCGPGRDRARLDRADRAIGCERVTRP